MEVLLVHKPRNQLVESVAKNTMVIVLRERTIFLVVVSGHKVWHFPNVRGQYNCSGLAQASSSNDANKKYLFYFLLSIGDLYVEVFFIDVYALLDPDASLSLVIPLIA